MYNMILNAQYMVSAAIKTSGLVDGVVKLVAGILIAILAGAAVWVAFKGGAEYFKGTGNVSILGIVAKVLGILVIMGLIIALAANYATIAAKFGILADKAVDEIGNQVSNVGSINDNGSEIPEPKGGAAEPSST